MTQLAIAEAMGAFFNCRTWPLVHLTPNQMVKESHLASKENPRKCPPSGTAETSIQLVMEAVLASMSMRFEGDRLSEALQHLLVARSIQHSRPAPGSLRLEGWPPGRRSQFCAGLAGCILPVWTSLKYRPPTASAGSSRFTQQPRARSTRGPPHSGRDCAATNPCCKRNPTARPAARLA